MNSHHEMNQIRPPRFRPPLVGCVARDRQLALLLGSCYTDTFASIAAQIYRSLVTMERDRVLSDLFDRMATEELEQLRILGELIVALGGDGLPRSSGRTSHAANRVDGANVSASLLSSCIAEKRRCIDRYETLMSRTGDRVVRSVIAKLLSGERRMLSVMTDYMKDHSCDNI